MKGGSLRIVAVCLVGALALGAMPVVQSESGGPQVGDEVAAGSLPVPYQRLHLSLTGLHGLWLEPEVTDDSGTGFIIALRQFNAQGMQLEADCVAGEESHGLATQPYGKVGGYSSCMVMPDSVRMEVVNEHGVNLYVRLLVDAPPLPLPDGVIAEATLYVPGPLLSFTTGVMFGRSFERTPWSVVGAVEGLEGQRLVADSLDHSGNGYNVDMRFFSAQGASLSADCDVVTGAPFAAGAAVSQSKSCIVPARAAYAESTLIFGHEVTVTLRMLA